MKQAGFFAYWNSYIQEILYEHEGNIWKASLNEIQYVMTKCKLFDRDMSSNQFFGPVSPHFCIQ